MKAYIQFFDNSGNHSAPMADDYEQCESIKECLAAFDTWADEVGNYAERQDAEAYIFLGEAEGMFPCDCYPDYQLTIGPRGGIIKSRT